MQFQLRNLSLRHDPFPIGVARPLLPDEAYGQLLDAYPDRARFHYLGKVGHKYVLSEKFNGKAYRAFIHATPVWRELHAWIKSDAFIYGVLASLREHNIDLGFDAPLSTGKRLRKYAKNVVKGRYWELAPKLRARFEFSMLPADGGSVIPHTDEPGKIVTLVISMARAGEWDPAWGGATEVNRPKDPTRLFNRMNARADFEEMELLDSFAYEPNQAVVFVKTFNSWHSVKPMTGPAEALRRTLTINIEARG